MADNFLERKRRDYEERKAEWLRKRKHRPAKGKPAAGGSIPRPDDESL